MKSDNQMILIKQNKTSRVTGEKTFISHKKKLGLLVIPLNTVMTMNMCAAQRRQLADVMLLKESPSFAERLSELTADSCWQSSIGWSG